MSLQDPYCRKPYHRSGKYTIKGCARILPNKSAAGAMYTALRSKHYLSDDARKITARGTCSSMETLGTRTMWKKKRVVRDVPCPTCGQKWKYRIQERPL